MSQFDRLLAHVQAALADWPAARNAEILVYWSFVSEERYTAHRRASRDERKLIADAFGNEGVTSQEVLLIRGTSAHLVCWEDSTKVWVVPNRTFELFFLSHLSDGQWKDGMEGGHTPAYLHKLPDVALIQASHHRALCEKLIELGEIKRPISADTKVVIVEWEILPEGEGLIEDTSAGGSGSAHERASAMRIERLRFVDSLKPIKWWRGRVLNGASSNEYLVAEFDRIFVAECPQSGNAIYYLVRVDGIDWQSIFKRTKQEALDAGAKRVLHTKGWKDRLIAVITSEAPTDP